MTQSTTHSNQPYQMMPRFKSLWDGLNPRRHSNGRKMSLLLCFFRQRFFVGILCLSVVFSELSECTVAAEGIILLSDNPYGVVGMDMRFNCTLTNKALSWQNLVFTIVDNSQGTYHPIPASAVRKLNDWSAELTLRNLTQSQHRATVFCKYRHPFEDSQNITVVGPPAIPMIYYHRYLNWKEFVFRWNVSRPSNGIDTKYIAWFKTTLQSDFSPCNGIAYGDKCKCTSNTPNGVDRLDSSCHIVMSGDLKDEVLYDGNLQFKVNATNIAGSATSENIRNYIEDSIEPGPVTELSVSSNFKSDVGRFVDVVSCQTPISNDWAYRRSYTFEIHTKSEKNLTLRRRIFKDVKSVDDQGTRKMILNDLNPYTVYNLTIRSRYEYIGRQRGYWSKWSSIKFTSHEEAPIAPPAVCQCCFEVDEDSVQRTAFIYFKPLTKEESRGIVSYYMEYTPASAVEDTSVQPNSSSDMVGNEIAFLVSNKTQVVVSDYLVMERTAMVQWNKSDAAVFRLDLSKSGLYQMKVNAKTIAGHSPRNPTTVIIPTRSELLKIQPPSNCSAMSVDGVNENRIVFRWNKMKSTDENVVDELGKVTIFWCKAFLNSLRCQQPLNWMEPDPNVTSVHITLSESYEGYLFGIGRVLKNGFSSGIHWTCSYFKRNAVASPPHLVPLEIDDTKVVMTLEKPNYSPKEGLVYGFNLYYSPFDYEGQRQDLMLYVEDVDDWWSRGRVTIEGLKRGTSYEFKAESLTSAGPSYSNASVYIVTRPFRLTENALGFIIFGAVVVGILAFVGFACCIRWPHAKWIKLKRWIKFEPCMPSVVLDEGDERQRDSSCAGYSIVPESTTFDREFNEQVEDDEVDLAEPDRPQEDRVQPYSCITTSREDCHQIGCHHPIPASGPEHILPLLERRFSGRSIHEQLLPNLAETSEQSDTQSSNDRTASSTSNDRTEECIADGILPISSHRAHVDVSESDTDGFRPIKTYGVMLRPAMSTLQRSVVIARDRCLVHDNSNSNEHINSFNQHMMDDGAELSQQIILQTLLESGRDLKTRHVSDNLCELESKASPTEQTGEKESSGFDATSASDDAAIYSAAELYGRSEQTPREMRDSSSSPFSSNADEISETSEDKPRSGRSTPSAPRSLEDDEGIYL